MFTPSDFWSALTGLSSALGDGWLLVLIVLLFKNKNGCRKYRLVSTFKKIPKVPQMV